jgi:hypothetical protein
MFGVLATGTQDGFPKPAFADLSHDRLAADQYVSSESVEPRGEPVHPAVEENDDGRHFDASPDKLGILLADAFGS